MERKRQKNFQSFAIYGIAVFILAAALVVCFLMVHTINYRMNESATSNLLNTTQVIENSLENNFEKDLEALNIVGEFYKNGEELESKQIFTLCETLGFDWIGVVDAQGTGIDCYANQFQAEDIPGCELWEPGQKGYSDAFIGRQTGRPQTLLWVPVYQDEEYRGTVLGSVILSKYYSADIFTFYNGEGRTFLFDGTDGKWILRSLGTDGTLSRQEDIYSLLLASGNEESEVTYFRQAVEDGKSGTAVFDFNGEESYLCFLPLPSSSDWYVTTVIAKEVLLREASEVRRMIHWVFVILCLALITVAITFAIWRVRKTRAEEAHYREALFANISANLDSSFLIYEKNSRSTVFVSDNVKRILNLERDWLREDAARLFNWCGISEEDPQRIAFLNGTLRGAAVREICIENEMGVNARFIRLELIPADLDQEIAVLTDITRDRDIQDSLKDAMQNVEAACNAKNDFLSAMSHDIRTPINGIAGMTAIAMAQLDDKDRVRNCLEKISDATSHLCNLINEVLDMSQIESGKIVLTNEQFNLPEVLQNVLNMNYPGIQQKKHKVEVHMHLMEHEEVIGDPAHLTRITTNLISNAIKYTPQGGVIEISLREISSMMEGHGYYEITVRDNGIGMSKEFQGKLFEPFEREEDVRISKIQGTGLGMAITKNLVDLMMGDIQVDSDKGKGSIFRVTVNLRLAEQGKEQEKLLNGISILVVDENVTECETITGMLCNMGIRGEWVKNGTEAGEIIARRHQAGEDYLAVLIDWNMNAQNGIEVAKTICAEAGSWAPRMILMAYDWSEIEAEAKEAGIDMFLSKPIYRAKLLQKMQELVAGQDKDRQIAPPMTPADRIPPGKRVLVAEDNDLNMEIAVELLHMIGIQADCAENGAVAVERFENSKPGTYDLILMDIQMPKMNGYEAARAIRGLKREDSQIPIIAMTADAFKRDQQAARAVGMNAHLAKPISVEWFIEIMAKFLSNTEDGGESIDEPKN